MMLFWTEVAGSEMVLMTACDCDWWWLSVSCSTTSPMGQDGQHDCPSCPKSNIISVHSWVCSLTSSTLCFPSKQEMQYHKTTYKLHNLFYDKCVKYNTFKETFTENSCNRQIFPQTPAGQNRIRTSSIAVNMPHVLHIH